jgi:streptogramin lyase
MMMKFSPRLTWLLLSAIVGFFISCRDDAPTEEEQQQFNLVSSVFIPVGVLREPQGIAVDASGNVWVADTHNGKLRKFLTSAQQADSMNFLFPPTNIAINKRTGDLLVVEDGKRVREIVVATKTDLRSSTLNPFFGNADVVLDVNTNTTRAIAPNIRVVGDIESTPNGDVVVSAYGSPENLVIQLVTGNARALAFSATTPSNSADAGSRFVAVDRFGTVFTSFTFLGTSGQNVVRGYSFNPANLLTQSKVLTEPFATGSARGATIADDGKMFVADSAAQELVVFSTLSEKTVLRSRIPDTNGFSMSPRDVAVATDGTVYVVVTDRNGTDAGAVLKYTKSML